MENLFEILNEKGLKYLKNKHIFLTGGTGYLGKWLLRVIEYSNTFSNTKIRLTILSRKKTKAILVLKFLKKTSYNILEGDIRSFKLFKGKFDYIFHLASETEDRNYKSSVLSDIIVNGTNHIISFAKINNIKNILFLSSGAVYGKNCINPTGWKESDLSSPSISSNKAAYGISKKLSESILYEWFKKKKNHNLLIVRAFSFGGSHFNKGNLFAFDNFIRNRVKGNNIILATNGRSLRNFIHPVDMINQTFNLLQKKGFFVFNSGSNENISIFNLAKLIAEHNFKRLPKVKVKKRNLNKKENYIPNVNELKKLKLLPKISLKEQIEEGLNYYYRKQIKKIIAFDLDGTLVNSGVDLINSLNQLLIEKKQRIVKIEDVKSLVGNGAAAMIKKAYNLNNKSISNKKVDLYKARFLEIYKKNFLKNTKLFPYVKGTLKHLHENNYIILLISNKPEYFVKRIVSALGIKKYFSVVTGGDTYNFRKPDKRHLTKTIEKLGLKKYECLFVGDSLPDALCAKRTKSKLVLLSHGYSQENIDNMGADLILDSFSQFKKELSKLI